MLCKWPAAKGSKPGRSNGSYSCSPVRKDTYERYILKGTPTELPDVVSMQLAPYQVIDIDAEHRQYWSSNPSTSSSRVVHIVEEGIALFGDYDWQGVDMYQKRMIVARWLSEKYRGKGKNSFLFKNYINGILTCVDSDYDREFCRQVAESINW